MLADHVHAGEHGEHRVVPLAGGEQAHDLGRGGGEDQVLFEAEPFQALVHDAAAEGDHLLAAQILKRRDRTAVTAGEDGVVHDGVRWREVHAARTFPGVGDSLQDIDRAVRQAVAHVGPVAEAEGHLHPHHLGDGPGEVYVEAGGLAVLVDELIGGIGAVASHHDGALAGGVGAGRGVAGPGDGGQEGRGQEQRQRERAGAAVPGSGR